MNRNISLASRDPLPLGREDIYKGMEEIGAYLDVTPRDFQEIYAHAYKIARGRLLSSITAGDIMHVPVLCVAEEQSVRDLVIFLDDHRISGAPAVDADGRLSGVVSESDVVRFVGGGETVTVMHLMHTLMRQGCVSGADLEAPVATAIALMHVTKTLHPPGGATALIAVTGGEGIHQLGYLYAFVPCLLGALIMLAIALIVNNIPKAQRYPQFWW